MRRNSLTSLVLLLLATSIAWSQIPQTMSFQGALRDPSGSLVADGNYSLTFKIYDGANELWSETQPTVAVGNGVFGVILGTITPLNLAFDKPYDLGITVGAGTELTPRTVLTSSAYSLNSASVADGAVTTAKIADGAVTAAKLAPGAGGSSHTGAIYRWNVFSTYDQAHGWFAGNSTDLFGGINPSNWTDNNGIAANMTSDMEKLRSLFTRKGYGGKNALVYANQWKSYSSTNGKVALVMFRIKNTTGSTINWNTHGYQTSYGGWGEKASVALNQTNIWDSGNTDRGASDHISHVLPIPANAISTAIFISTSSSQSGDTRACFLAFDQDCLDLPAGLEFVDDLDTATSLLQSF